MLRVIALVATLATAGTLAGTASAHPPDINDVYYGSTSYGGGYGTTYTQPYYGNTQPYYGTTQPYYGTTQPYYGNTYGTSSYVSPSYTGTTYAPTYDATPLYSKTYTTPRSYSGYSSPSYGYRQSRKAYRRHSPYVYGSNAYDRRPLHYDRHRSYGAYSDVPATEGYNYGYSGGPTYGDGDMPVINGVRVNTNPN